MFFNTNPEQTKRFLEDTSNLRTGHTPGVYFPENREDIRQLLEEAASTSRRLVIAGNGTGTTGGRIPFGDYVVSMEKLNRIGKIQQTSERHATITVEAGALLEDIQRATEAEGWLYPPDPTEKLCFIGSTIANNSSGARTYKYGPTRNHVSRISVALASGEILDIPRGRSIADQDGLFHIPLESGQTIDLRIPAYNMPPVRKHNAGYYSAPGMDLIDLFIGSEGTLGIILDADLELMPQPEKIIALLVYFPALDNLFSFLAEAMEKKGRIHPRALEMFEHNALGFLRNVYPDIPDAAGALFIEQETTAEDEDAVLEAWLELMETHHTLTDDSWVALDKGEQADMKEFRHALPVQVNEWLSRQQESKVSTDMAVPLDAFRELVNFYRNRCEEQGFHYIIFGHAGDGHVHLNILPKNHDEFLAAKQLYIELVDKVIDLHGTLSAEHGIGKLKSPYLERMFGKEGIMEMVRIKKTLDPTLMLNVGNLIAEEYLTTS